MKFERRYAARIAVKFKMHFFKPAWMEIFRGVVIPRVVSVLKPTPFVSIRYRVKKLVSEKTFIIESLWSIRRKNFSYLLNRVSALFIDRFTF